MCVTYCWPIAYLKSYAVGSFKTACLFWRKHSGFQPTVWATRSDDKLKSPWQVRTFDEICMGAQT
ncbi:MAG: hypothetical protein CMJ62_12740 [Planctomycetaceae bacterium]|jgi:hypothetical protein|nr:hypothetical protein [Planctomycetaceae bacterium]